MFKHALIQDAAYRSLLKEHAAAVPSTHCPGAWKPSSQRPLRHNPNCWRITTRKQVSPNRQSTIGTKQVKEPVERSAHVEAISHLRQGLALLQTLPETPERLQREVDMHIALGASLLATKGYAAPEVGQTYTRRSAALSTPGRSSPAFPCVAWTVELLSRACRVADGARPGRAAPDPGAASPGRCHARGGAPCLGGDIVLAGSGSRCAHALCAGDSALRSPAAPRLGVPLWGGRGVICHSFAAWTLWYLGYPDQGLAQSQEAVTLAQQSAHPFSLSFALSMAAMFHQFRREVRAAQERAEAAISLATEQGFPFWMAFGLSCVAGHWRSKDRRRKGSSRCTRA